MSHISYSLLVFSLHLLFVSGAMCKGNQMSNLNKLIKSIRSAKSPHEEQWTEQDVTNISPSYIVPQDGSMETDRIDKLPGQPKVAFDQYAGYVTVDAEAGRALFYYFAESPHNHSSKPLVLWLNGGPGCSSLGNGAIEELGPFRVNSDGKSLYVNDYAWNNVANVLFLESPAGTGFSYSNRSSDYITGDKHIAKDSYTFLINWLHRFPQYKTREFFIMGESYAGHIVPQLASIIYSENKKRNQKIINLRRIAIGNPWIDYITDVIQGKYDYLWSHALISDETNARINKYCDFVSGNFSDTCKKYQGDAVDEYGNIEFLNIYAPVCDDDDTLKSGSRGSEYVSIYLNRAKVQEALHAHRPHGQVAVVRVISQPKTILPIINQLIGNGIRVWLYSGDIDAIVPVTSTRYAVNKLKLQVQNAWRPWYYNKLEVGGYVVGFKKGLVFMTVRGAGHMVPSDQPERALVIITSFLEGKLPPPRK